MSEAGQALIKVGCSNCGSKYSLPRDRLKGRVLKIRCKSCDTIFEVRDKSPQSISARGQRRWFAVINRERMGPMTAQQVRDRFSRGEITLRTYVWRQGMEKWERLHRVPELGEASEAPKETLPPVSSTRPAKGRANTLRLVRLGSSKDEGEGEAAGGVKWAHAATRTADLSGMAELSELQRQQDALAEPGEEPDDDADVPTQVRRVGAAKGTPSRPLYETEEETTKRAVYVDPKTGEAREEDEGEEVPEEEPTRRAHVAGLTENDTDVGGYDEDAGTVDQLGNTGERVLGELANFANDLNAISDAPTSGGGHPDTVETDRPPFATATGPEIAIEPPARPGAAGRRLAQERGQDSVLFSLDHLKADAQNSFARAPTVEPKKKAERRSAPRHELTPVAEELFVPPADEVPGRGGGLRFVVGMLVGAALIFGVLFAVNPQGMKRLLGLAGEDPSAGIVLAAADASTPKADATVLAAVTRPADAGEQAKGAPVDGTIATPDRGATARESGVAPGSKDEAVKPAPAPVGAKIAPQPLGTKTPPKPQDTARDTDRAPKKVKKAAKKARRSRRRRPRGSRKRPKRAAAPLAGAEGDSKTDGDDPPVDVVDYEPAKPKEKAAAKPKEKVPEKGTDTPKDPPKAAALPDKLTRDQVKAGLAKARSGIKVCAKDGGMLTVEVTISGSSGRAVGARVLGALVEDEVKSCVAKVVKQKARFPKFSQARMTAKVPLVLR